MANFQFIAIFTILFFTFPSAVHPLRFGRPGPLPPSRDPFYVPPPGYENTTSPGDIIRHRKTPFPISAFSLVPIKLYGVHQILYRSSDSFGNPTTAITSILIPYNADRTKLVSYQVVEDAAFVDCAPSYALQQHSSPGGAFGTIIIQSELLLITAALQKGWIVALPDYEGPTAAFLANWRAGYAILDGIRAALNSAPFTRISPRATITLWGTSGGSMVSGFAAELHQAYAPELNIVGAALGGIVPQITTTLEALNEKFDAGIVVSGILGLSHEYPELRELLNTTLVTSTREKFMKAETQCSGANSLSFNHENIFKYFHGGQSSNVFAHPTVKRILANNSLPHSAPKAPIMLYKSLNDEISPIADTDKMVEKWCAWGATVVYKRDRISIHTVLAITGAPDAIIWLGDRMNGVPLRRGCQISTIFMTLLQPGALKAMSKAIIDNLLILLGQRVGRFRV
ncbi:hypothetical protein FQN57_007240 [Myotisia sp. PD_48]|nr:hypothetical protein FQN57_007240 [Myotisia sp. PD_48]